jgi:hypothetical protein
VGNSELGAWTSPAYKPDCAGCHAGDYKPDKHDKINSPQIQYTVSELRDCAGACHEYTDSTMTTIEKTRNNEHSVSKGGW